MVHFYTRVLFIVGLGIGIFLGVFLSPKNEKIGEPRRTIFTSVRKPFLKRTRVLFDDLRYGNKSFLVESDVLQKKIPIFCLILVKNQGNLDAAKNTWAKGCTSLETVNLIRDRKKPLPLKSRKENASWLLLCKALREIPDTYSWILIVYDYTFVITENLRFLVHQLNPRDHHYFGHPVEFWGIIYNLGQAGYVLSQGTLKALKNELKNSNDCEAQVTYMNKEDYYLGRNLRRLNITAADTRDSHGLSTFHPYNWFQVLFPGDSQHKMSVYPQKCCSPHTVAFQSIEGDKMYTYYYLLYTLQLFHGGVWGNKASPGKPEDDNKVWRDFLKARDIPLNVSAAEYYKIWVDLIDEPDSFAKHMRREEYDDYDPL